MLRKIALLLALTTGAAVAAPVSAPLTFTGNSDTAFTYTLPAASSSSVFVGFDFSYTGVLGNNDYLGLWFGNANNLTNAHNGPNFGVKANCGASGNAVSVCTNDVFGRTTNSNSDYVPNSDLVAGTTYKLFAHLYKTGNSSYFNAIDVWLNPTMHEMNALTGADLTVAGRSNITSFDTIGFRTAFIDNGVTLNVSNLRINEVPEPGSVALMGLALAGLAAVRRKRA